MLIPLKKLLFIFTFNSSLFLLLMIGIQNSSNKNEVNLLISKSVALPISFIIGISFISGSLTGNLLEINFNNKKKG
tara:strand:- start:197 stop:424 length:228 start_codon:yes stop_codon:yes gene_type:complete